MPVSGGRAGKAGQAARQQSDQGPVDSEAKGPGPRAEEAEMQDPAKETVCSSQVRTGKTGEEEPEVVTKGGEAGR